MEQKILNYIKTLSDNEKMQELLFKTIGRILLKQDNLEFFIQDNETKIIHIRDWISSIVEHNEAWKKPRVSTIEALNNSANKYFEKKNNKLTTIELNEKDEKLIADLDNYYIVQMLTPEALDNESKAMQHCIGYGNYDLRLKNENYQYLSLRDKYNKAHATLEIKKKEIKQLQGKQDKIPEEKYLEIILPWLIKNNYYNIPWLNINRFYDIETKEWIDKDDIIFKKNIDYKEEIYNNLNVKHYITDKGNFYYKENIFINYYFDCFHNFCIINNLLLIQYENNNEFKKIKNYSFLDKKNSFKSLEQSLLINIINYLLEKKFTNIPWNDIEKYPENNKLVQFEDVSPEENIDYIVIKQDDLEIKRGISNKFKLKYLEYNSSLYGDKNILLFNDIILYDTKFFILDFEKFINSNISFDKIKQYIFDNIINKENYIDNNDNEFGILTNNLENYIMNFERHFSNLITEMNKNGLYLDVDGKIYDKYNTNLIEDVDYSIERYKDLIIKIRKTEKFEKFYEKYIDDNFSKYFHQINFVINDNYIFITNTQDINNYDFNYVHLSNANSLSKKEKKQIAEYILYTDKLDIKEKNRKVNLFGYHLTVENKLIKCNHMKLKKDIDYKDVSEDGLKIIECVSNKAIDYFHNKYNSLQMEKHLNSKTLKLFSTQEEKKYKYIIFNDNAFVYIGFKLYKDNDKIFPLYKYKKITFLDNDKIYQYIKNKYNKNYNQYYLDFSRTDVDNIDYDASLYNNLDISYCKNLSKLPKKLNTNNIEAVYSKIKKIPNDIVNNIRRLNLYKNKEIKELPENLNLEYLIISRTNMKTIPNNLSIINWISLYSTKIKIVPDNVNPSLSLGIAFCKKLTKIPDNLKSKEIRIDENQINLIKETMQFEKIYVYRKIKKCYSCIIMNRYRFLLLMKKNKNEIKNFFDRNFI